MYAGKKVNFCGMKIISVRDRSGVWGEAKYRFMKKMEIKINLYAGKHWKQNVDSL